ncbi:MAG TPA: class I adenylate-forming enzyme family protein [Mycobacteriales bacterium]|nr:class I adenylate-forming enzyme family protein [Mycobacteriales bacterium]
MTDLVGAPSTIPELLRDRRPDGDRTFVVTDAERLSYAEADARSAELAAALLRTGIGKGTRVGLLFPNGADFVVTWLAAARIGALTVPLSTFAPGAELVRLLRHTDVSVILMAESMGPLSLADRIEQGLPGIDAGGSAIELEAVPYLRRVHITPASGRAWASAWPAPGGGSAAGGTLVAAAEAEVTAADDLVMVNTSGTTAAPKSVVHTHGGLVRHAWVLAQNRRVTADDRIYSPMPFFWVGGLTMVLLQGLSTGATVVSQNLFEPGAALELLERERVTLVSCWQQASRALADHPDFAGRDLSSVRGGTLVEALPPDQRPPSPELTPNMLGMTETGGPHTMPEVSDRPLPPERSGSYGVPVPGVEHRVVDESTGQPCAPGDVGILEVRGAIVMDRIHKRERADVFTPDGWYSTGDRGWFDEAGHLHFEGRAGTAIKTAGSNVSPPEVEAIIDALPGVLHSYVIGLPHPTRGEVVAAAVVCAHGAVLSPEEVEAATREQLSSFKVPSVIRLLTVADVPMLPTGKVDVPALRAVLLADHARP